MTCPPYTVADVEGAYLPNVRPHVRDQVERYERSGGTEANTLAGTDLAIIVVTMRGAVTGAVRKVALLRIEHRGEYLLVASDRGRPANPAWYRNLLAHPADVWIQDGPTPARCSVRELDSQERTIWWERACRVFADYTDYQARTERRIPLLLATPTGHHPEPDQRG